MNQEILNIIISGVSVIVTGLCSWAVAVLINWLNAKIKDQALATFVTKITIIVTDAVKAIYQEFVEVLKKDGKFDKEAQEEAKRRAICIINGQLTKDMKKFITENFGDIEEWIGKKIEAVIYNLKNQQKERK